MRVSNVRFEDFPSLKKHIAQEAFSDEKFLLVQFSMDVMTSKALGILRPPL